LFVVVVFVVGFFFSAFWVCGWGAFSKCELSFTPEKSNRKMNHQNVGLGRRRTLDQQQPKSRFRIWSTTMLPALTLAWMIMVAPSCGDYAIGTSSIHFFSPILTLLPFVCMWGEEEGGACLQVPSFNVQGYVSIVLKVFWNKFHCTLFWESFGAPAFPLYIVSPPPLVVMFSFLGLFGSFLSLLS